MNKTWTITISLWLAVVTLALPACEDEVAAPEPVMTAEPIIARHQWYQASPPLDPAYWYVTLDPESERARWYHIEPHLGASSRDFDPDLPAAEDVEVPTLHIEVDSIPEDSLAWTGIMRGFAPSEVPLHARPGTGYLNLSDSKYLQVWINDFKPDPSDRGGEMFVEIGFINEDFFEPEKDDGDTEDRNFDGFVVATEDTGFDHIAEEDGDPRSFEREADDFSPDRDPVTGKFERINGTEGNLRLDSEDLDGSGTFEYLDSYLRYRIDLSASAYVDIRRDFPDYNDFTDPEDSWRLYLVPLTEYEAVIPWGTIPFLHEIHHMRIWFWQLDKVLTPSKLHVQIGDIRGRS